MQLTYTDVYIFKLQTETYSYTRESIKYRFGMVYQKIISSSRTQIMLSVFGEEASYYAVIMYRLKFYSDTLLASVTTTNQVFV